MQSVKFHCFFAALDVHILTHFFTRIVMLGWPRDFFFLLEMHRRRMYIILRRQQNIFFHQLYYSSRHLSV